MPPHDPNTATTTGSAMPLTGLSSFFAAAPAATTVQQQTPPPPPPPSRLVEIAPPAPRAPVRTDPPPSRPPEVAGQGDGYRPTFGVHLRRPDWVPNWVPGPAEVRIDTPVPVPEIPSVRLGRWTLYESAFDRQQAYIAEHGRSDERISPLLEDATVGSPFGRRRHPINGRMHDHNGVDIRASSLSDHRLVAPVGGFVLVDRNPAGNEGVMITIYGDDGNRYRMLHMREGSIPRGLSDGDRVEMGQQVGVIGNTGRSTAAHLHLIVEEPTRAEPRSPGDFRAVDPDRVYDDRLRRGGTLHADIDAPRGRDGQLVYASAERPVRGAPERSVREGPGAATTDQLNALTRAGVPISQLATMTGPEIVGLYQQVSDHGGSLPYDQASPAERLPSPQTPGALAAADRVLLGRP